MRIHFRLVDLRRLPHLGSDHFPVLIEVSLEPEGAGERPRPDADDDREARERIARGERQPAPRTDA